MESVVGKEGDCVAVVVLGVEESGKKPAKWFGALKKIVLTRFCEAFLQKY